MARHCNLQIVSLLLRISIVTLFFAAGLNKLVAGHSATVGLLTKLFTQAWLPLPLVVMQATLAPYIEIVLSMWLLLGFRLKLAWIFSSLFMISLAFGLTIVQNFAGAAQNYFYVVLCLVGILLADYDHFCLKNHK